MDRDRKRLLVRARRWRDWAAAIEGADELRAPGYRPDSVLCFVDTSEVVEYVLPHSLRAGQYPTRLDIALTLLFGQRDAVFTLNPHAREINGIRQNWEESVKIYREELAVRRRQLEEPEEVTRLQEQLRTLAEPDVSADAGRLIGLILENTEWLFDAWRVPFAELPHLFDELRRKLRLASCEDLGLPPECSYQPNRPRVDEWFRRLDRTKAGRGEPVANLVDAYALDQLEAIAEKQPGDRIAILMSHSGKIMEALRDGRRQQPDLLRKNGVSLVQPPQVALVWRLRQEAPDEELRIDEELERQRERGFRVGEQIDRLEAEEVARQHGHEARGGGGTPKDSQIDSELAQELDELERLTHQWHLLQRIRQAVSPAEEMRRRGVLEELVAILRSPENQAGLSIPIDCALAKLDEDLARLERNVANHLAPPEPPRQGLVVLEANNADVTAYLQTSPGPLDRPRSKRGPSVPSAAYPIAAFVFADERIGAQLKALGEALREYGRTVADRADADAAHTAVGEVWRGLQRVNLRTHPEHHLLLAVVFLDNERWFQAYDAAGQGLAVAPTEAVSVRNELLLARAVSARNWVLAEKVERIHLCETYLGHAINFCLEVVGGPSQIAWSEDSGRAGPERALRELAVAFGSSREPVFGPKKPYRSLAPRFDRQLLAEWTRGLAEQDSLSCFVHFARLAYQRGGQDSRLGPFYTNTLLYALTEADQRSLDTGGVDRHATERAELAASLDSREATADPNFADTLMWHFHVLSRGRKQSGRARSKLHERAQEIARSFPRDRVSSNAYYSRLSEVHRRAVLQPHEPAPNVI